MAISCSPPVISARSGEGRGSGTYAEQQVESEETLDFSVLAGVRPQIETISLEKAFEAYQKMKSGDVKFRMVLTMKETRDAH